MWQELNRPMVGILKTRGEDQTDDRRTRIDLTFWRISDDDTLEYMTPSGTIAPARLFQFVEPA